MEKDWVKIFNSVRLQEVEIIKGVLAENGILSVVLNNQDSFYRIGSIDLYVERDDVLQAKRIINQNAAQ